MQSRLRWLFFFITLLSIVTMAARVPLDTDQWWHIHAGEISLQNHSPLLMDTFSYTNRGEPWVNHSWLAQIVLAILFRKFSYFGLCLYVVLLSCLTFGLLYFVVEGHPFFRSLIIILGAAVVSTVWSPRPQLFTLLCLGILVFSVTRYRQEKIRQLWWIPGLFTLWGNLHAGYVTGILYLLLILISYLYEIYIHRAATLWKPFRHFLLVSLLSIPALLINPNGIEILKVPFSTLGVNLLRSFIDEWASPDFHQPLQLLFLLIFLGTVFLFAIRQQRVNSGDVIPVLGFALLAFYAKRNIAPLMIVLLPVLSVQLYGWWEDLKLKEKLPELWVPPNYSWSMRDENPWIFRVINLGLVFILGLVALGKMVYVSHPIVVQAYLAQQIPVSAYEVLKDLNLPGNVLNEYGWGGYQNLFYPDMPVFVDGRTDLFGDERIGEWMSLVKAQGDYKKIIERYAIQAVLLNADRPINQILKQAGWQEKYADANAILLIRP